VNNKLSLIKQNYYQFTVLKEMLIQMVEKKGALRVFGKNFIIKEQLNQNGTLKADPNFCLVQTVYGLQHWGI